jgi:DNA-binding NtrC family response regulator
MGEAMPASSPEVLLVEDEALIGLMIEDALTEAGFSVHTFRNGRDALAYLAAGGCADVLFTDIDIAGDIDGVELARRIRALRAGIAVVCSSGRHGQVENAIAGSTFLPKPFILAQACAAVERTVARRHAA